MSHKIQKQVLELDIPSGNDSWRFQNELRDTFNQLVLPRLEKACNELGIAEGTTLKIDSLLLDTGEITSNGMAREWVDAIEYQFREQIRRIKHKGPSRAEKVEVQTSVESAMDKVLHFLNLGVLPWWSKEDVPSPIDQQIIELLETQRAAFITGLRRIPNRKLAIHRLLNLLSTTQLDQFRAALGIQQSLVSAITPMLKQLKIANQKEAIKRLETTEIAEYLSSPKPSSKTIFYAWFTKEIDLSSSENSVAYIIYRSLLISNLKTSNKLKVKKETSDLIKQVIEQLIEEKRFTPAASVANLKKGTGPSSEEGKRSADRPKGNAIYEQQEESSQPANSLTTKDEHPGSATAKKTKKNSDQSDGTERKSHLTSKEEWKKDKERNPVKEKSVSEETGEGSTPFQSEPADTTKTSESPAAKPVNQEDEHVLQQLARIRKAALERQARANVVMEEKETSPESQGSDQTEAPVEAKTTAKPAEAEELKAAQSRNTTDPKKASQAKSSGNGPTAQNSREASSHSFYPFEGSVMEEVEECYIENAGLVLFWPFLSRFFKNMGYMENGQFAGLQQQEEAAMALQYLLGEDPDLEEFSLPLNKLLCALPIEHPMSTELELTATQKAHCQELLQSTIQNWGTLKGTSIPGFQGSFLNRQGVLKKQENGWLLQVEKMAFDMLLEQLPWPVSIVKLTWMENPIYVEW